MTEPQKLTDQEMILIGGFADSEAFEAVKKVFTVSLKNRLHTLVNDVIRDRDKHSNEEIGAQLRACAEGTHTVKSIFAKLARYKKEEPKPLRVNTGK